jgi:hypothetical protein
MQFLNQKNYIYAIPGEMRPPIKAIKQGVDRGMLVVKPFNPIWTTQTGDSNMDMIFKISFNPTQTPVE